MPVNLVAHLVAIAELLVLDPVLRFLLSKRLITRETSEAVKNPFVNVTVAARNTALVDQIDGNAKAVDGFMTALRQTGQAELAERIETDNDGESSKTLSDQESAHSSERSGKLRAKHWTCPGLPGVMQCPAQSEGQWENTFNWCRHKDCRRYLCSSCLQSEQHTHKPSLRVGVKPLHAAAYERVKKDDAMEKKKLCILADDVGQKVSEALQNYLLAQWDQQSSLRAFEEHLFVNLAAQPTQLLTSITSEEARTALGTATDNMGGSVPQPKDVVPESLKDLLLCSDPRALLAGLLTPGHVEAFRDDPAQPFEPEHARSPAANEAAPPRASWRFWDWTKKTKGRSYSPENSPEPPPSEPLFQRYEAANTSKHIVN